MNDRQVPDNLRTFRHESAKHDVYFAVVNGTVVGDKVWSETEVHSTGGGAAIGPQGTYGTGPVISSTVTTKREIWIKQPDGREVTVVVPAEAAAHAGNEVSLVYAGDGGSSAPITLVNRTSGWWTSIVGRYEDYFQQQYWANPTSYNNGAVGCILYLLLAISFGVECFVKGAEPNEQQAAFWLVALWSHLGIFDPFYLLLVIIIVRWIVGRAISKSNQAQQGARLAAAANAFAQHNVAINQGLL